jgi:D-alanyl-lipoteichoic acid acyltransferase DltB (MBOAT superfamily)
MLTMLLGGLWHGASWTFVIWGGLHGLFLAVHRALGGYVPRGELPPLRIRDIPKILSTFALVCLLWVFFRAMTMSQANEYLAGIFSWRPGPVDPNDVLLLSISVVFIVALDIAQRISGHHAVVLRWPALARGAAYALLFAWIVMWSGCEAKPFIYFQF